jgi:ferrous-iron efflux pump FieF
MHYKSDLLLNLSVILAMGAQTFTSATWIDPVCGLGIAAWLANGAWKTASEAIDHLMDREWDEERRERLIRIVAEHGEVTNLHDLRTRTSGSVHFAQFHVDMPDHVTVGGAHDVLERIEADLAREFPDTEVFIHIDPKGHVDEPENPLREMNEFEVIDLASRRKAA